jgi:hypothetical protein
MSLLIVTNCGLEYFHPCDGGEVMTILSYGRKVTLDLIKTNELLITIITNQIGEVKIPISDTFQPKLLSAFFWLFK